MPGTRRAVKLMVPMLTLALLAGLLAAGCGGTGNTERSGQFLVGSDTDVLPFEGMQSGKMVGFDVDLGTEIAKRLGLEYKLVPTQWNNLLPDLKAAKYDAVIAAMTITFDRQKTVDFSDPYFETDQSIVVMKDSPINVGNDLAGKVVGVLENSTPQDAAQHLQGLKEVKKYPEVSRVYQALANKEVDAMIMDLSIARYRSKASGDTRVIAKITTTEEYGIAVKKGASTLLNKINSALKEMKSDGTYNRIEAKWFGSES
jgi:polar amino acid transport system substrate-binding protein